MWRLIGGILVAAAVKATAENSVQNHTIAQECDHYNHMATLERRRAEYIDANPGLADTYDQLFHNTAVRWNRDVARTRRENPVASWINSLLG